MTDSDVTYKMGQGERVEAQHIHRLSFWTHALPSSFNLSTSEMTSDSNETKGARTAIVIYTLHGHIGSRESDMSVVSRLRFANLMSRFLPVAESVKAGVDSAGGNATIYQ